MYDTFMSHIRKTPRQDIIPQVKFPVIRYRVRPVDGRYMLMRSIGGGDLHPLMLTTFPTVETAMRSLNSYLGC